MQLGIFAKTFTHPNFEDTFNAVRDFGLECVQFNFSCAGLPTLPQSIDLSLARRIRAGLERRSLFMAAVSGTCNLIHPDASKRAKDLNLLGTLIRSCGELGTSVITLCTGTRDPSDMWRAHRDNQGEAAWRDLVISLEQLLPAAEERKVVLGIEPEPANVIDSARLARKLLDELNSPCLKIVFDAANLLRPDTLHSQGRILSEAAALLGPDIVLAHAKDLTQGPGAGTVAAGKGALDYRAYLSALHQAGFSGPLILHSLDETEVSASVAFVRARLREFPA